MARARNIKPGFFKNEELVNLPYEVRLFFIGLWTLADRDGRLEDRPKKIKMELFPADNVDIEACLNSLAKAKFIIRYEVAESKYIQVVNFLKHQNPHHKETPSTIPKPEASLVQSLGIPEFELEKSGASPADSGFLVTDSLIPDSLIAWMREHGFDDEYSQAHWEYFVDYLKNKKGTYKDTDAAFRNCVKADWGAVRAKWVQRNKPVAEHLYGKTSQGIALLEQMKG